MIPFCRRRRAWVIAGAALILAGIAFAALIPNKEQKTADTAAVPALVLELAPGDITQASKGPFTHTIAITGTLEAVNQTTITAPVEAEVAEVRVRPGVKVKKGDVLLRFSTRDLQLRLTQQQAQVDSARAQLQLAKTTYEQQKALLQQQFISKNAFQNAESALTSAQSQLKAAEAQRALAGQQVENAAIHAPFTAWVAERRVEPGQRVGPNTPLLKLVDTSELELMAAVAGQDVAAIREGQLVDLFIEGHDDKAVAATVVRIAPAADAASRRIPVYIRINNPAGGLQAGLFAHGQIIVSSQNALLSVPSEAVHKEANGQSWVWRITGQRLHKQAVITGSIDKAARRTAILKGLTADDQVLTVPGDSFEEGQAIKLGTTTPAVPKT